MVGSAPGRGGREQAREAGCWAQCPTAATQQRTVNGHLQQPQLVLRPHTRSTSSQQALAAAPPLPSPAPCLCAQVNTIPICSHVNLMPACSRSLVMLTPPVEAEQGPLALVRAEMSVENSVHCMAERME